MVYSAEDGHPCPIQVGPANRARRALTSFTRRTPLTTTPRRQLVTLLTLLLTVAGSLHVPAGRRRLVGAGGVDAGAVRFWPTVNHLGPAVVVRAAVARRRRRPPTAGGGRARTAGLGVVGGRGLGLAEAAREVLLEAGRQRPRVGAGDRPHRRHGGGRDAAGRSSVPIGLRTTHDDRQSPPRTPITSDD